MAKIDIFIYSLVLIPFVFLFSIAFFHCLYYYFRERNSKENTPKYIDIKTEFPKGITPAMAGYIYDKSFSYNWKYLSATIIDMAIKGLIKLEYCKDSNKIINITEGETNPNKCNEYKYLRALILVLFGEKTKYQKAETESIENNYVKNQKLKKDFLKIKKEDYSDIKRLKDLKIKKTELWTYIILPIIRKEFKNNIQKYYYLDLNKRGFYLYTLFILTILVFLFIIIISMFSLNFYLIIPSIIFIIISIIIFIYYTTISSKRTTEGNNVYVELSAYKNYLTLKEIINTKKATQELYEKHLPYAIALGVKYEWSNRFKENSIKIPKWFVVKDKLGQLTNLNIPRPDNISYRLTNKVIFMYDKEIVNPNDFLLGSYFKRRFNL